LLWRSLDRAAQVNFEQTLSVKFERIVGAMNDLGMARFVSCWLEQEQFMGMVNARKSRRWR
jgi:hypothetical protein